MMGMTSGAKMSLVIVDGPFHLRPVFTAIWRPINPLPSGLKKAPTMKRENSQAQSSDALLVI